MTKLYNLKKTKNFQDTNQYYNFMKVYLILNFDIILK